MEPARWMECLQKGKDLLQILIEGNKSLRDQRKKFRDPKMTKSKARQVSWPHLGSSGLKKITERHFHIRTYPRILVVVIKTAMNMTAFTKHTLYIRSWTSHRHALSHLNLKTTF